MKSSYETLLKSVEYSLLHGFWSHWINWLCMALPPFRIQIASQLRNRCRQSRYAQATDGIMPVPGVLRPILDQLSRKRRYC